MLISFLFYILFIYLPMAVQYHYFLPWMKKNEMMMIPACANFSTNSWLVWKLSYSFNYSKLERSLQRGDNTDKASVTSISLEIIWCQSLFICCILRIVVAELIHWHFFWGGGAGGGTQSEEMRKGCDLACSNPFILSLNLIGVAQLARCIAPQIVSNARQWQQGLSVLLFHQEI